MATTNARAICVGVLSAALLLACGDDDGDGAGGGSGGGGSYGGISQSLAKPSGTLASSNAVSVAESYEELTIGGGEKQRKQVGTQTMSCPAGGSYKVDATNVTQSSVTAQVTYSNCCQQQGCCMNGDADWYYATSGSGEYPYCGRYDITSTCGGTSQPLKYEGCFGTTGWVLLVKVDGKSYAVTGSYVDGNGELKIKDATASWTCKYTNKSGTCTGGATPLSF